MTKEHFSRALLLHMSALVAIEEPGKWGQEEILNYVLNREKRFLAKVAGEWMLPVEISRGLGRAMALITSVGGVANEDKAIAALRSLRFFADEKESMLSMVVHLLRETYPGELRWIDPMMPDLLGEQLIKNELGQGLADSFDQILGRKRPAATDDSHAGESRARR
ncbi:MAG: hypothetical protein AAGC60_26720 [Acidobacteriota bacterium]